MFKCCHSGSLGENLVFLASNHLFIFKSKKLHFSFTIPEYLFPIEIFCPRTFCQIKPSKNVEMVCEEGFVVVGFHTTHFYLNDVVLCECYTDTTHIRTFGYVFQNNYWTYILFISTNRFARAGYDTRSNLKRCYIGLNSEFSFSLTSYLTKAEEPSRPCYLPIAGVGWRE